MLLWNGADVRSVPDDAGAAAAAALAAAAVPQPPRLPPPPPPPPVAGAAATAALLSAWRAGALRCWSRRHHAVFSAAFRADVASLLLACLGSSATPGERNPLRLLSEHKLLRHVFVQLLKLHMGALPRAAAGEALPLEEPDY